MLRSDKTHTENTSLKFFAEEIRYNYFLDIVKRRHSRSLQFFSAVAVQQGVHFEIRLLDKI